MRIIDVSNKGRVVKVYIESEEDLWTLKILLRPGDLVEGLTTRDVAGRLGGEKERRPMIVKVRVENVEFQPFTGKLRIFGVVVEGPEEYGVRGKHHSMTLHPGQTVKLERPEGWSERAIERMRSSGPKGKALIASVDYDEYALGILSMHGFKILLEGSSSLPGKDDPRRDEAIEGYVDMIARAIVEATADGVNMVIITGPGPLKHHVAAKVSGIAPSLRIYTDDTSMGGAPGLREALRRPSILEHLREFSVLEAESVLEEFMSLVVNEPERVAYGVDDVRRVAALNALKHVVVLDSMISSLDDDVRSSVDFILSKAEDVKARITIIPEDSPPGERIKRLGGVIAVLRYPIPLEARQQLT